ncbi:MAG TPA: sulfatase-like hydrolase/transferase [Phycisphaerae bacterium]|nr:sulfatase-like hydrolase/transferase [Phycisphaerae bacterium]
MKLRWTFIAAAVAAGGAATWAADKPATNLVFIMTDDQAVWSMGCYGNPEARTPTLDRMASEGIRFTRAYATIPVCSPSRATFLTGRIASQHGIHDWIKWENMGERARYAMQGEVLLSDTLSARGYTCGLVGKWHLGDSLHPHAGFSYWFALPQGSGAYNNAPMCWQGEVIDVPGYITDGITDHALKFMEANKDRPFFLFVSHPAPHSPWTGHPQDLVDEYMKCPFDSIPKEPPHPWISSNEKQLGSKPTLAQYFAAVSGVDRSVGRILKGLDDLKLADNTLVVYTSDQGYNFGHHGLVGKGNASNPRNMYDTSMQIPLIFRQPGRVPGGAETDAMFSAYDFVPTVLDYMGLPPSSGRNLPGKSFARVVRGEDRKGPVDAVFGEYGRARMIRTDRWKLVHRADGGPDELYDLQADPGEKTNLADKPELRKTYVELRTRIFKWFEQCVEAGRDPVGQEYLPVSDGK